MAISECQKQGSESGYFKNAVEGKANQDKDNNY